MLPIDPSWKEWIDLNKSRGCDKEGMARILWANQFDPITIVTELAYLPQSPELIQAMNQALSQTVTTEQHAKLENPTQLLSSDQALNTLILPLAQRLPTDKACIYTLNDFLNAEECAVLIKLMQAYVHSSALTHTTETDTDHPIQVPDLLQNSNAHALIQNLELRIAYYMGIEIERSEALQGQYYPVGTSIQAHTDYFEPNIPAFDTHTAALGQRTWSFMLYLNDLSSGGETAFTTLGIEIKPRQGMAVIWNNRQADGQVNPHTLHWEKPAQKGEKYVITKWFRERGTLSHPFFQPTCKRLPVFTPEGFKKLRLPADLYTELLTFYRQAKQSRQPEQNDAIGTFIRSESAHYPAYMLELSQTMRQRIVQMLKPLLEAWVGRTLKPSAVYGIREYQRGATLAMHVDRVDTHHVSVIINVAQQVDKDWELLIHDHLERAHPIIMQPGDMLFYESARLQHGRPVALEGDYFANIFAHTTPVDLS